MRAQVMGAPRATATPTRTSWLAPVVAVAIILLGALLRLGLIVQGWPGTDSDDATMGLMARHILYQRELPIFFWGQAYMGSIEAYLAALLFAVFGPSLVMLKAALILLYAAFEGAMYALLARAFSRRWALAGVLLLSLGSDDMLYHQLNAYGGYLETLLGGALLIALTAALVRRAGKTRPGRGELVGYGAWGLTAGLALYSDPLVAPFVALSALALVACCWRRVRGQLGMVALVALLLGLSPWAIYIATAPTLDVAKSFLRKAPSRQEVSPSATATGPSPLELAADHVLGVALISVPNNTGATTFCPMTPAEAWPPSRWSEHARSCMPLRAVWGVAVLALLGLALTLEVRTLRRQWRRNPDRWTEDERAGIARTLARTLALAAPTVTVVLFAMSSASATAPWEYSRYIITLLIALPVMCASLGERVHIPRLAPLHPRTGKGLGDEDLPLPATERGGNPGAGSRPARQSFGRLVAAALPAFFAVVLTIGVIGAYRAVPEQQARNQRQADLVRYLVAAGETRVYSEFWTCYRMAFQSDERVVCSVLTPLLAQAPNRYPPYDTMVRATPDAAYVFPLRTAQTVAFLALAKERGWRLNTTTIDDEFIVIHVGSRP